MECKLCNLCENCTRPVAGRPFLDNGASPAEIMLIGDFPKREDITYGKPFSDKLSIQLANLLNTSKLPADKIYITNLVKCRPVAPNGLDGRLKIANVQACQVHLIEEIATVNPKLIILFGDSVFRYFYPKESFSDNRGKILSNNQFNIPTIATYHPQAMLATAKFDQIINTDLAKAYSFLYGDEQETQKPTKDYRLVTKSLKLLESIAKRVKEVPTFAFDIETHGEGLFNYKLLSIGLSWKKDTGVSIPVWVLDEDKAAQINAAINYVQPERFIEETVTLKSGKTKIKKTKNKEWLKEDDEAIKSLLPEEYKDLVGTCTFRELKLKLGAILDKEPPLKKYWGDQHDHCMALIKEILECDTPKGAHNGSYDVNRLRGIGINVKNYDWDTILEHHLLDEERPHGLDDLSFVYTKDGGYKSGKNVYLKSTKTSWANIPMEVLLPYNAQDADVTFQLHEIFVPKIKESEKRWKLYMKHIMPAQRMLCDMEFRGSNIDMSWVQKTKKEYLTKMNDLKIKFSQLVEKVIPNVYVVDSPAEQKDMELQIKEKAKQEGTEPKFPFFLNMNSTQQLLVLFRDYYKVTLTKKTKSGDALDSDVLLKIGKKIDAANVLLEYKALKKVVSTYLDSLVEKIDADGKLHTEFLLYGTRTSRLSSRNPNLQNQPAEVKYMFVPPSKDYVCVNVDQSAAELHVLAWLANDKKMMGIFEAHRDLHKETAASVFNKKMEDITSDERKIAKRCFSDDTFILTEDGYIRGRDIGNRKVYTLDGKLQNQHHVYEERTGFKFTLKSGWSVTVTDDHKFQDFSKVVPTWKEAKDFKVGDVIGTRKEVFSLPKVYVDNTYVPGLGKNRLPQKIELSTDLAYLLGLYLGCGSLLLDKRWRGGVAQLHLTLKCGTGYPVLNRLAKKYTTAFNYKTVRHSKVIICNKELAFILDRLCGHNTRHNQFGKHIPEEMFKCSKEVVTAFISGIIDSRLGSTTSGSVCAKSKNEKLIRDLCKLATLNGYDVLYKKDYTKRSIKVGNDPKECYSCLLHKCTFVSKPELTLYNEMKCTGLKQRKPVNDKHTWFIPEEDLIKAGLNQKMDYGWTNYHWGCVRGLTDSVVIRWGIEHAKYWAQEIVSIEHVKFRALIMETDTHFFVGNAISSPNCSFGIAYGVSGVGLKDLLEPEGVKITDKQGDRFIKKWRDTYPGCARYLDNASKNFNRYGYLETPFGRRRHKYKHYMSQEKEAAASRQAGNFLIQSTASDIQVYEMVHMYKTLVDNGVLPVFTVHDSIVMYCPINKLEWLRDYYKQETCRRFPQLNNLLMYTEMEVGRNYGEHVGLPYDCDFAEWKKTNAFLFGETNEAKQGL